MKFSSNKIIKLIKKNIEIAVLFLLLSITVTSTTIYNNKKRNIISIFFLISFIILFELNVI